MIFTYSNMTSDCKPAGAQVGAYQKPANYTISDLSIEQIGKVIASGRAWRAGIYDSDCKSFSKANVKGANILALDFDQSDKAPEAVIDYAISIGLRPSLYYYSYSQGKKQGYNFRLLWVLESTITPAQYELIYSVLLDTFKDYKPDNATKDCSRLWFGTKDEARIINEEPIKLSSIGWVSVMDKMKQGTKQSDIKKGGKKNLAKAYFDEPMPDAYEVPSYWWQELGDKCVLWRMWEDGEYLDYNQRLTLFANIQYLKYTDNNKSIVQDVLQFYNEETYKSHTCDEAQIRSQLRAKLRPFPIVHYKGGYMTIRDYFALQEHVIYNTMEKKTIEELDAELETEIPKILSSRGIQYVVSPAGGGKTEQIINYLVRQDLDLKKIVYCAPRYNLIDEFAQRFKKAYFNYNVGALCPDYKISDTNNIEDEDIKKLFDNTIFPIDCCPKGIYTQEDLLRLELGKPALTKQEERGKYIKRLLRPDAKGLFVITHHLCAHLENLPADIIIIDENIEDVLINTITLSIDQINALNPYIRDAEQQKNILELIKEIKEKNVGEKQDLTTITDIIQDKDLFDLKNYIANAEVKAMGLFRTVGHEHEARIDTENGQNIVYITIKSPLFENSIASDMPIKLFTATSQLHLLQIYYQDVLFNVRDFGTVKNKVPIIQYTQQSGAKGLNNDKIPALLDYAEKKILEHSMKPENFYALTFKGSMEQARLKGFRIPHKVNQDGEVENIHQANCSGLDYMNGYNLSVIGKFDKPENYYTKIYYHIHPDATDRPRKQNIVIKENNVIQLLYLWEDQDLRQIQTDIMNLYTAQATMRARSNRTDAQVFVFSNYPIKEADIYINN